MSRLDAGCVKKTGICDTMSSERFYEILRIVSALHLPNLNANKNLIEALIVLESNINCASTHSHSQLNQLSTTYDI